MASGEDITDESSANQMEDLPAGLLEIIRLQESPRFLDILASKALKPELTLSLFSRYGALFADCSGRWISNTSKQAQDEVIAAFARILPLAPHLSVYLHKYLWDNSTGADAPKPSISWLERDQCLQLLSSRLLVLLLATWRLINFDAESFSSTISSATLQDLFQHRDMVIRFLAVNIFCRVHSASDARLEALLNEHVGSEEAIMGDFDGKQVDYGFLPILEDNRLHNTLGGKRTRIESLVNSVTPINTFSPLVVKYKGILLPRPSGPPSRSSALVPTTSTLCNLETLASSLLTSSPILLHGLAGSGKSSLVNDIARELSLDSKLVTLHLNEQTDAKMLIGMYVTGIQPGSFTWRAGILTTAVQEGRWILIEDLDRAPKDVLSVLLPLMERRELVLPNRGLTVKASPGFKLFATIRTLLNVDGEEKAPTSNMLGARLWRRVAVQMPAYEEFREIIDGMYPILRGFSADIISVYQKVYELSQRPSFASKSRTALGRPVNPRDLIKWCRRLDNVLITAGSRTGQESITDGTNYELFREAVDCFAGSQTNDTARRLMISCIAEEMHIGLQHVEYHLHAHIPRFEEDESSLTIGRTRLLKKLAKRFTRASRKTRPFANTTHAKRLLEQISQAVNMVEPLLLVGETGIGKTTIVQQLAERLGYRLIAVNLSQQSEVGDLLGGYKPVNVRSLAIPLKDEFEDLFSATGISASKNQKYIEQLNKGVAKAQWTKVSRLWREAPKMFERILQELSRQEMINEHSVALPNKRRKLGSRFETLQQLGPRWNRFSTRLDQFDVQLTGGSKGFAFTFVEGNIVKAVRNGDWVLLDEVNLASPDTLESIADLLHSGPGAIPFILLSESGDVEKIQAHPNFRIFGAMNPATDVGKKDLPAGLRSRFTEIYVESPDKNLEDLRAVIKAYLPGSSVNDERVVHDVARLYMDTKRLAAERRLVDGANQVPHFSLRTLTRVLSYVAETSSLYGLRRALYEGFAMGFLTLLDRESENMLLPLINHCLLDSHANAQALLSQPPRHPDDGKQYVRFVNKKKDRHYWMIQGEEPRQEQPHYIITPFVERNILNLVRATSTRQFPVLIQGPTSSGKTSMIEYLAKFSGHKFVRINNHEHTDLQEYLGTYVSDSVGHLTFQEGLLVQALRQGHWIVLDELNLAPTEVLEALNRLLDDNRELLIPETQEIVRPHANFMLFATQNPPGLYGGRKTLSRAFRNRFLELHFDDIPEDELEYILEQRSQKVAPSDCRRIVAVYKELCRLRQTNRLFEQKHSFATLRDLFRWALRDAENREQLAANGYMLLAERVRNPDERIIVKDIIERAMKVKIDTHMLYDATISPEIKAYDATANELGVVWTRAMRRLYILVAHALRNNEPVLLVGETGCGKTTVCQMLAEAFGKHLHIVNAHQNTETGDIIGAQRPIRNRGAVLEQLRGYLTQALTESMTTTDGYALDDLISTYARLSPTELARLPEELQTHISMLRIKATALFEWSDGNLVQAMRAGQYFLLDEISLADDSVLERLNSVLEPQRTILLAEKGVRDSFVQATEGFQIFATMNPGGDYGKRELSPALRNRFTEIWVSSVSEHVDIYEIVEAKLEASFKHLSNAMVGFAEWFGQHFRSSALTSTSVRDVLAWVNFVNACRSTEPYFAVLHGAAMVYVDTIGANPAALFVTSTESIQQQRAKCLQQLNTFLGFDVACLYSRDVQVVSTDDSFSIGNFRIGKRQGAVHHPGFAFTAPTTKLHAMRVLRALQIQKPILLEGSPGVGKTTLIAALASACGQALTRINLSEQTDLIDLFGSDVPVEGAEAGYFAWRDAPFLQAMQKGEWVLLDEMNLASQSVLEGLNACLDHRGEVYISELDQTFTRHPDFRVFAAQNPHHQGGGRKGLPTSFVNRFTIVYADVFSVDDLELICNHNFPTIPHDLVSTIVRFVPALEKLIVQERRLGSQGGHGEFNLRDVLRWLQLLSSKAPLLGAAKPSDFLNLIFRQRFRTAKDRIELDNLFSKFFTTTLSGRHMYRNLSADTYQVGQACLIRNRLVQRIPFPANYRIDQLPEIESIMTCIQQNLPCILVGSSRSGKSNLLQHIAAASGKALVVFPLNADIDAVDLVGGFEQVDSQRTARAWLDELHVYLSTLILEALPAKIPDHFLELLEFLNSCSELTPRYLRTLCHKLCALAQSSPNIDLKTYTAACKAFTELPMTSENACFEWVDGILIKALKLGSWLVLDNSNLCSSSVLDRLNSLLEPNGILSINEHCGPNGEPEVIRPHPEFRIFLTMDPRFGELSRAMRNRAIEVYLEPSYPYEDYNRISGSAPEVSSLQRFRNVTKVLRQVSSLPAEARLVTSICLDHLSWADMLWLPRYSQVILQLLDIEATSAQALLDLCQDYISIYQLDEHTSYRQSIGRLLGDMAKAMQLPSGFEDAQTIHPLQNSPLVLLLQQRSDHSSVYWLAVCFEAKLEIASAWRALKEQQTLGGALKPSHMNRFQRSLSKDRLPILAKDSTAQVSVFLAEVLHDLGMYLSNHTDLGQGWKHSKKQVIAVLRYWWETYDLSTTPHFEEANFQAMLAIGSDTFQNLEKEAPMSENTELIRGFQHKLQQCFESGFKLTTGLSMELLWKHLRPIVVTNFTQMRTIQQLELLAERFDQLRWNVSISINELSTISSSLGDAYRLILNNDADGTSLVSMLEMELDKIATGIGAEQMITTPFFSGQFEALRQIQALAMMCSSQCMARELLDTDVTVLSNYPTSAVMTLNSCTSSSVLLQSVGYLWADNQDLRLVEGNLSCELLQRMHHITSVDLGSLKLLEAELPVLGRKISSSTESLCHDHVGELSKVVMELLMILVTMHGNEAKIEYNRHADTVYGSLDLKSISLDSLLRHSPQTTSTSIMNFALTQTIIYTSWVQKEHAMEYTSIAWVSFAMTAIRLYVPDRAFDPDKRNRMENQRHIKLAHDMEAKLEALQIFERICFGGASNLRCQLLQEDLANLGEPPAILHNVFRPEVSELDQLHGEFNNLLSAVLGPDLLQKLATFLSTGDEGVLNELELVRSNVDQIICRLAGRFRAYRDLTTPAISFLRCLQIGLLMAVKNAERSTASQTAAQSLARITPFMGGTNDALDDNLLANQPMECLSSIAMTAAVEETRTFSSDMCQKVFNCFHSQFEQWTERLESDRLEAESRSRLYRFRGTADDEEEHNQQEFDELFPTYDENNKMTKPASTSSARDIAIEVARFHANIFFGHNSPTCGIYNHINYIATHFGALQNSLCGLGVNDLTGSMLPVVLIKINDALDMRNSASSVGVTYNFYTDPNLSEARKLVSLIHRIQARFQELHAIDEIGHMQPLADVLDSCREVLRFGHTEPLAKIITKVEKIHAYMHEWQFGGWAAKVNSCQAFYDEVTAMIVSWRRLELSTWARLFDLEVRKCEDDAMSWWFIAYRVVIAVPLSMADTGDELRAYAVKLLIDLELYFSSAILGQFEQRLQLLSQLHRHLRLLVVDHPSIAIIDDAVTNFISFFLRYKLPVQEQLIKGRTILEKAMRDVLLLASWKDTNINALRDSAKSSHHKLFKLVRKFRSLLAQPIDTILKQGIVDSNEECYDIEQTASLSRPSVDQSALSLCASSIPGWSEKSNRFVNVSKTIDIMATASEIPDTAVNASTYLTSYLSHVTSSIENLRRATPTSLTEDNKDTIKHIKSRKRKLFTDVLRELRQWGFKYNLSEQDLSKQVSLSLILSAAKPLPAIAFFDVRGCEYYFTKAIELAPKAREACRQHLVDLSGAETARSLGYLEGCLQVILNQRNNLAAVLSQAENLKHMLALAKALEAPNVSNTCLQGTTACHEKVLLWLPRMLSVGIDLIKIHAKLGERGSEPVHDILVSFRDVFFDFLKRWKMLPHLPEGITYEEKQTLEQEIKNSIRELTSQLGDLSTQRPDLRFILDQIQPWTKLLSSPEVAVLNHTTIADLDAHLSLLSDMVLTAVQTFQSISNYLPASREDAGWLLKSDNAQAKAIVSLHAKKISRHLEESFDILRKLDLDDRTIGRTANARYATALPVLEQYYNILQRVIVDYGNLHRVCCKTSCILTNALLQIATQGFCTPPEKSDAQDGNTDKAESGTGLGDGEGAEDVSKDIQDEENLEDLAQEPNTGEREEMENEKDAVDMADGDMEGEMGDAEEEGDREEGDGDGQSQSGDEMDEEAGSVDDLDPTAIDEKKWDRAGEEGDKDQDGNDQKGERNKDEQVAAKEGKETKHDELKDLDEEVEGIGAEQEEMVGQDDIEKNNPHAQETEALDLPDDMELDGGHEEDKGESDAEKDDLSDIEGSFEGDEVADDGEGDGEGEDVDPQEDQDIGSDLDDVNLDEVEDGETTNEAGETTNEAGEPAETAGQEDENEGKLLQDQNDVATADENAVPSDVQAVGEDQNDSQNKQAPDASSRAPREDGGNDGDASENKENATNEVSQGRQAEGEAPQDATDDIQDSSFAQPFKKLGDALERWHRQQKQIRDHAAIKEGPRTQDVDMATQDPEFQHLQDENAEADAQALGTATSEQAHALDESMAIDNESKTMPESFQPDELEQEKTDQEDVMDVENISVPDIQNPSDAYDGRVGAMIKHAQENDIPPDTSRTQPQESDTEDLTDVDNLLNDTHLDAQTTLIISKKDAHNQWSQLESLTLPLSLSLTEQLRLILLPTQATKMRGDYRTGKRLNIKRIIPYIASSYKRDKIWMRRSVPSKRNYQIMLALDDSKSMKESGSAALAFETLAMVSKALAMLEAGEVCVLGFGQDVRVAHSFEEAWAGDAGPKVLNSFNFAQDRTDVLRLVRESISLFRMARERSAAQHTDLWQLELIISDGVCDSREHEHIRRLLREALEERIMMVFVVVDDVRKKQKGESVMDLKEAKFVKNEVTGGSEVRIERYLDTFPFQYYLIVSDIQELPGVLATLLRQWFSQVSDAS